MSNIKLYVVRHGATIWNKETRYQGQTDISLSEEGERQAEMIAARFKSQQITAVYSSPLLRAYNTAKAIAYPHHLQVQKLDGMMEIGFGEWEGKQYTHVRDQYTDELKKWIQNPLDNTIPGGEPLPMLRLRVERSLDDILSTHDEGNIVMVAHSGSIRMLFCILLKMDLSGFWRIMQFNGAVNLVDFRDGTPTVFSINDVSHMI